MATVPAAAVTAEGIRNGDPLALVGLVERRGAPVLATCERVAAQSRTVEAAADAFARFRRAVLDAEDLDAIEPERLLLSCTREAAAARAPRPSQRHSDGRSTRSCARTPKLLAARAANRLTANQVRRFEAHLERCPSCRRAQLRFRGGERAYVRAADEPPPAPPVARELVRAMLAVGVEEAGALVAQAPPAPAEHADVATAPPIPALEPIVAEPPAVLPVAPEPAIAPERAGRPGSLLGIALPGAIVAGGVLAALVAGGLFDGAHAAARGAVLVSDPPPAVVIPPPPVITPLPARPLFAVPPVTTAYGTPATSAATTSAGGVAGSR